MKSFFAKHWPKLIAGVVVLGMLGYVGLGLLIGSSVKDAVALARSQHPGDAVTALLAVANDSDAAISQRNRAVWALGQLGSPTALPVLQSLQAEVKRTLGDRCDHDNHLCQKELTTAIAACQGGTNAGAWMWRRGDLATR